MNSVQDNNGNRKCKYGNQSLQNNIIAIEQNIGKFASRQGLTVKPLIGNISNTVEMTSSILYYQAHKSDDVCIKKVNIRETVSKQVVPQIECIHINKKIIIRFT